MGGEASASGAAGARPGEAGPRGEAAAGLIDSGASVAVKEAKLAGTPTISDSRLGRAEGSCGMSLRLVRSGNEGVGESGKGLRRLRLVGGMSCS